MTEEQMKGCGGSRQGHWGRNDYVETSKRKGPWQDASHTWSGEGATQNVAVGNLH
jgi:hypothetical protein